MAQIRVTDLTFYYEDSYDNIFENVSFEIDTDWKLGFIGRNGRGKTTFLKLLMGQYEYRGTITAPTMFEYFPYQVDEVDKSKNVIDIIEQWDANYELWKVCRELNLLEVDADLLYQPFDVLSGGERTKIMLAVLFAKEDAFLLIDEPTNHLDMDGRVQIRNYLRQKKGFILISHDRWFLDACVDHILVINKANITVSQGNFSQWWENKQRDDAHELAENERLKRDITKMTKAARQASAWADKVESTKIGKKAATQEKNIDRRAYIGEKSRRMQMRRKNIEGRQQKAISEKGDLLKNIEQAENLQLNALKYHKEILLRGRDLSLYYGDREVVKGLTMELKSSECLFLKGKNGSGKTTLIKKILGQDIKATGILEIPLGLKISYVAQDTSFLKGPLGDFIEKSQIDEALFKALLRKMDFDREQFDKMMEDYSSGQKKKVLLAKSLCEPAHLYIWDEPLNYIDIFSRMQIEALIEKFRPTMIMIEHDKVFMEKLVGRVIEL